MPVDLNSHAEILDSSLDNLDKFTICGSFKTYQFFNNYNFDLLNKNDQEQSCQSIISTSYFSLGSMVNTCGGKQYQKSNKLDMRSIKSQALYNQILKRDWQVWKENI